MLIPEETAESTTSKPEPPKLPRFFHRLLPILGVVALLGYLAGYCVLRVRGTLQAVYADTWGKSWAEVHHTELLPGSPAGRNPDALDHVVEGLYLLDRG